MSALIFGVSGQDGFYLSTLLRRQNIEVTGISRSAGNITGDVSDWSFVENIIRTKRPDYVFHLAANSTTNHDAVFDNHQAIATGTLNILEAVYKHSPGTKVFLAGSALQFENRGAPIDERTSFAASSSYAVSRIQSVYAARYYRSLGIKVYVGYLFNHDSPHRTERHVNQKIVLEAKRIAAGSSEKLELGDITVRKEFNFAGDIVKAIWILINQDNVFEAVIGSGLVYSVEKWLDLCFAHIREDWRDYVITKTNFKSAYNVLQSNPALIKSLGWQPEVGIDKLAEMMMEK